MKLWVAEFSAAELLHKVRHRVLPNVGHLLTKSRIRTCGACNRRTIIAALGSADEFRVCLRCRANLRYELLATYLRRSYPDMGELDVLELDPGSPLRPLLARARTYTRSFYRDNVEPGTVRADGVVCQDITRLTFADASLDVIVSSDVLEHVPDPAAAFRESARVLRRGGVHVFTVPPLGITRRRAELREGEVVHLIEPPDYHLDPLDRRGVLVFWEYGLDLPQAFATDGLAFRVAAGPVGTSGRIVWEARRL